MPECTTCARAPYNNDSLVCRRCFDYTPLGKPVYKHWARALPTNADLIRSMSDEELAKFIDEISGFQADYLKYKGEVIDIGHMLDWLRQPAEEASDGQTV